MKNVRFALVIHWLYAIIWALLAISGFTMISAKFGWILMIIGRSGYQLFNPIITLLLILSGVLIWICMEFNQKAVAFALLVHEYISYLSLVSVIWHIFDKVHILIWPKSKANQDKK